MNKVFIIATLGICGLIGLEWYATHVCMDSWNSALRTFVDTFCPCVYAGLLCWYVWRKTEESIRQRVK